ncbi:hypothetical protein [Ekhidna sp.]|jgi:hypothetical protein
MEKLDRYNPDDASDFDDRIEEECEVFDVESEDREPVGEEEDFYRHLEEY